MEHNNPIVRDANSSAKAYRVRAAIYARCASTTPISDSNPAVQQIRTCIQYAEKRGWRVAAQFVEVDTGTSGSSFIRCESLVHLLEAAILHPRPFDCVLVAAISRLGRSLDSVMKVVNAFHGHGVFIQTVRGEFDSRRFYPGPSCQRSSALCSAVFEADGSAMPPRHVTGLTEKPF